MFIAKAEVANYKSIYRLAGATFGPGFNIVVGPNNAGKTALLEALSLQFPDIPHRSAETTPRRDSQPEPRSSVRVEIAVGKRELGEILSDLPNEFFVPHPDGETVERSLERFWGSLPDPMRVGVRMEGGSAFGPAELVDYTPSGGHTIALRMPRGAPAPVLANNAVQAVRQDERLPRVLAGILKSRIYRLGAERMHIGECPVGNEEILTPNASNLASVLQALQTRNPPRFKRFCDNVRIIIPEILQVTSPNSPNDNRRARILLWSTDPSKEMEHLAVPLAESGTGISQVLAILHVLVTADSPRVFLIDEPQSFLHPSALRKLVSMLSAHPEHQYVISTHSPVLLAAAQPTTITLLRKENARTELRRIDPGEASDLRSVLAEVGARPSDVFGADNVLWVEGATEEACIPVVWGMARKREDKVTATVVLGVRQTGDFEKRDATATIRLYRRLVNAGALMPTAVGFLFDRETRSENERRDLEREGKGLIAFLPRRMFENYLLNAEAIAGLMNSIEGFRAEPLSAAEVEIWIDGHGWNRQYLGRTVEKGDQSRALWLQEVDAGSLLRDMFRELSEKRVEYDKVRHGLALTRLIAAMDPAAFDELVPTLRTAMGRAT